MLISLESTKNWIHDVSHTQQLPENGRYLLKVVCHCAYYAYPLAYEKSEKLHLFSIPLERFTWFAFQNKFRNAKVSLHFYRYLTLYLRLSVPLPKVPSSFRLWEINIYEVETMKSRALPRVWAREGYFSKAQRVGRGAGERESN